MLTFVKHFERYASIAMMVVICLCIVLQVFFRYCLSSALEWPEEVARYTFICAVFLGASLAAEEGRHLEITAIRMLFGPKGRAIITVISSAATVLFCLLMMWWGVEVVGFIKESGQVAASIDMEMWLLYLVVPISMACMAVRTVMFTIKTLRSHRHEQDSSDGLEDAYADVKSW